MGGHIILHKLNMVVESPPGCTALVLSACVRHDNAAIGDYDFLYSDTFQWSRYFLRYVQYEFPTVDTL